MEEEEQLELAKRVILEDCFGELNRIGGTASTYFDGKVISGAIVIEYGQVVEEKYSVKEVAFPYSPFFLMFTEGPSTLEAVKKLCSEPDLLFVNGHGIDHPRRAGLACYVGVLADIPTIGVSKEPLVGEYKEPSREGEGQPLMSKDESLGWAVKPRASISSIFVSPGNRVSVETSLELALAYTKDSKLPEPIAKAKEYVRRVKEHIEKKSVSDTA